jgi:transposase-like protein
LTHGEICAHLAEIYGAQVSKQAISTITDRVMDGMADWQNRPLDSVYPVIFIDCIHVKIREGTVANRPIYVALAVTVEGHRDILGLWAGEHGDGEGAKYWLRVLSEIKNRGVHAWQSRPLDEVYPILYVDGIRIRVKDNGVVTTKLPTWPSGSTWTAASTHSGAGSRTPKERSSGRRCSPTCATAV